jgi:hypothetical protein
MVRKFSFQLLILFLLGGCASKLKDQMKDYRSAFLKNDFEKADSILEKSVLKKDKKSVLLWHMEKGTLSLARDRADEAVHHFQTALELIDKLFTTKLSSKGLSLLINDESDEFYGASYERSYAHYYLAKSLYRRYQQKQNKLDLQGARATILAWDSYFSELQRSADSKTLYSTDLMLKVFGGQIHEVSEIKNDKQIALQLYKDALGILDSQGGIFSIFNSKNLAYVSHFQKENKISQELYASTPARNDLKDFLHYKILSLTKEIRGGDFTTSENSLAPTDEVSKMAKEGRGNVVIVVEEGLIPQKVGRPFSFGIKGAMNSVEDSKAKKFIATVGIELITSFAMDKLGMIPKGPVNPGGFIFAHDMTKLAVQEAAIEFELPTIETVPSIKRLELFVMDQNGAILKKGPLPVISENGDIAKIVLEEDAVSRYIKTGTRVATKHLLSILTAMQLYRQLTRGQSAGSDFLAKSAALATYVAASKSISSLEKADTRHWITLPQAFRMTELKLKPGFYKLGLASYSGEAPPSAPTKILGGLQVKDSEKSIFTFTLN